MFGWLLGKPRLVCSDHPLTTLLFSPFPSLLSSPSVLFGASMIPYTINAHSSFLLQRSFRRVASPRASPAPAAAPSLPSTVPSSTTSCSPLRSLASAPVSALISPSSSRSTLTPRIPRRSRRSSRPSPVSTPSSPTALSSSFSPLRNKQVIVHA